VALLQPGAVVPSHGWAGKTNEETLATSSPAPTLSASVVRQPFEVDWGTGTVKCGQQDTDPEGSEGNIVDNNQSTEYAWWGKAWHPCGPVEHWRASATAVVTFERTVVRTLDVYAEVEIAADDEANWEYAIRVYDDDQERIIASPPRQGEGQPGHIWRPVPVSWDIYQYVDRIEVYQWAEGKETSKTPVLETSDVEIWIRFKEIRAIFGFIEPVGYRASASTPRYKRLRLPGLDILVNWMDVRIENQLGVDVSDVNAAITHTPGNMWILPSRSVVHIDGILPDGGSQWSRDFFVAVTDRASSGDLCNDLRWRIGYYVADDDGRFTEYRFVENVPGFPLGQGCQ
jgi:hypothetical protein